MIQSNIVHTFYETELICKEITFDSAGAKLSGKLFFPYYTDKPLPIVILSCGIGGRKEWFETVFPEQICSQNFALLLFDLRGHKPSEGVLDDGVLYDIEAAVTYAKNLETIDSSRIILAGQCLGALLCHHYAANNNGIIGIISISTFLPKPLNKLFPRHVNDLILDQIVKSKTHHAEMNYDAFFDGFAQKCHVLSNANKNENIPCLYVHYKKDPICKVDLVNQYIKKLDDSNNELIILDNDHQSWISKIPHAISYDDPEIALITSTWIKRKFL